MVRILHAYKLKNTDLAVGPGDVSDPFVVIRVGNQEHKTDVVKNNLNPTFNSPNFEFAVPNEDDFLKIELFNASQFYSHDSLGKLSIALHDIVALPGEVQPRKDALEKGGDGILEYELMYIPPEQVMAGVMKSPTAPGQLAPFMQPAIALHKPVQHKVPLPDFHGFGPAAFMAPPPEIEKAPVGERKKQAEYESWACHLGQYDYEGEGPVYFPNQDAPSSLEERYLWNNDPFYRSLEDPGRDGRTLDEPGRPEALRPIDNKDPFAKWLKRDKPRDAKERQRQSEELVLWNKDPFHDWLKPEDQMRQHPEGIHNEKIQEAKLERRMMALPSFRDDVKRFEDNREYVDLKGVAGKTRPRHDQDRFKKRFDKEFNAEQIWKEDAFFGWLPGRGEGRPELHRPFEDARMHRLPSFSEDRFLGLQGKGRGVLKVWVRCANNLRYNPREHNLRGRPSACVQLSLTNAGAKKKITPTIETETDPFWNTGAFQFEVMSEVDKLVLQVVDLLGQDKVSNVELGRVEVPVGRFFHSTERSQCRENLEGVHGSTITFDVLYQPYASLHETRHHHRPEPVHDVPHRGRVSVRPRRANIQHDSGGFGGASYYVIMKTSSGKPQRTKAISQTNDPVWDDKEYVIDLPRREELLELEVWNDTVMATDGFIGRVHIPVVHLLDKLSLHQPIAMKENLMFADDVPVGQLEVVITRQA